MNWLKGFVPNNKKSYLVVYSVYKQDCFIQNNFIVVYIDSDGCLRHHNDNDYVYEIGVKDVVYYLPLPEMNECLNY
jgi:hypothetical protein